MILVAKTVDFHTAMHLSLEADRRNLQGPTPCSPTPPRMTSEGIWEHGRLQNAKGGSLQSKVPEADAELVC
jgi:hypothetical protein